MIDRLYDLQSPPCIDDTLFQVYKEQLIEDSIVFTYNTKYHVQSRDILAKKSTMSPMLSKHTIATIQSRKYCSPGHSMRYGLYYPNVSESMSPLPGSKGNK